MKYCVPSIFKINMEKETLKKIVDFYLASRDFNGIHVRILQEKLGINNQELIDMLVSLVSQQKISVVFGNIFSNPHIKSFRDLTSQEQIKKLKQEGIGYDCIYPSKTVIEKATDVGRYNDRPFTKRLLLGEGQLQSVFFELDVLEKYLSDPRYNFNFYDHWGKISIAADFYESDNVDEKDKILLQTFGLGYGDNDKRVVVVFLRYLNNLSAEHQQSWNTYVVHRKCKMVDHYYKSSILAESPDHISIYSAFLEEQVIINDLVILMGKKLFFRTIYKEDHPKEFSFLLKSTRKNYNSFVHLLDKLISENINKGFFEGDLELEEKIPRGKNEIEVRQKGTLTLLEEWLNEELKYSDQALKKKQISELVSPLKNVRKLRQKPAHSIDEDEYDEKYNTLQRDLISKVYGSMRMLRLVFAKHPKTTSYTGIPKFLLEGKIRNY